MSTCYEIIDDRFRSLIEGGDQLVKIADGCKWTEGPVYLHEIETLIWSDIPNNRMLQWSERDGVSTFRTPSNFANGNTRDRNGRLVTCEHGTRRVVRTELDGSTRVVVDSFKGKKLNSPNDVVVKSDGSIWFTDPPYGILSNYEGYKANSELDGNYVFRYFPDTNSLSIVADDFVKPNGLAFSPDESLLYVADSGGSHDPENGPHHIRVFDVIDGRSLDNNRIFTEVSPGLPDGFRVDTEGNLWTSAKDGVHCYAPDGTLLGKILVPETVSNLTFGGPQKNRLFITATQSVYSVSVRASGAL